MKENIIDIHIKSKEDYKNRYNEKILSYDLAFYILEEAKNKELKQNIVINIKSDIKLSDKEKEEVVNMIRCNFGLDVSELINITKKERMANTIFAIICILSLIMYVLLSKVSLISQLLLIIGWVFIGEAICNVLYHGIDNYVKLLRRKQIINAKINFV